MVYGIFSQLDDTATKAFFKSKKVPENNVNYMAQLPSLIQVLKFGDVVHVVSVNRFVTVSQFFQFGKFCMSRGVALHLLAQPYLDISNGKHWKSSVQKQLIQMVTVERFELNGGTTSALEKVGLSNGVAMLYAVDTCGCMPIDKRKV